MASGQPSYLIKKGRTSIVKPTTTFPWLSKVCKQPNIRLKAVEERKRTPAVGQHERSVETDIPERLPRFTKGLDEVIFKFDRCISSGRVHTTSSSSSFRAFSSKNLLKQIRRKAQKITHFPKDPNCEVCRRTKVTRAPCKHNLDDRADRLKIAEKFRDMITADHKVLNEDQESRLHHRCAVVVQDLATQWIQSYPCKTKSAQETQRNLRTLYHPEENPGSLYTDNSLEFILDCEEASLESRKIYAAQTRNKWNCTTSCTTSERRHFVSIGTVWTSRKLAGRSHGVSLLSSKCARPTRRWADTFVMVGLILHLKGRLLRLDPKSNSILYHQKTKAECTSSTQQSFVEYPLDAPWTREEVGLVFFW